MKLNLRLVAAAVAMLGALSLSGCEQNINAGPSAARLSESGLEVAVCRAISATEVVVYQKEDGAAPWQELWRGVGEHDFISGDVVTKESLGQLFEESEISDKTADDGIGLSIAITSASGENLTASFAAGDLESAGELWTRPDGTRSDTPCPSPGDKQGG